MIIEVKLDGSVNDRTYHYNAPPSTVTGDRVVLPPASEYGTPLHGEVVSTGCIAERELIASGWVGTIKGIVRREPRFISKTFTGTPAHVRREMERYLDDNPDAF
jgi:hypothetical protein